MAKKKSKRKHTHRPTGTEAMKPETKERRDNKAFQKRQKAPQKVSDPNTGTVRYARRKA